MPLLKSPIPNSASQSVGSTLNLERGEKMESPPTTTTTATTNFFNLLTEEIVYVILDHLDDDPFARKSFSQVCRSFYTIESAHRRALKPRCLEFLPSTLRRYPSISHLDFSLCPCVEDDPLSSVSLTWKSSLRSVNLSGSKIFTHQGLSTLVSNCSCLLEIDLSNQTDLTDSTLKAIGEAKNLEKLSLTRCKSITDKGIGCVAVNCRKLRSICLRCCSGVTDCGVGLIAKKCKEIRSLDLSYLPVFIFYSGLFLVCFGPLSRLTLLSSPEFALIID